MKLFVRTLLVLALLATTAGASDEHAAANEKKEGSIPTSVFPELYDIYGAASFWKAEDFSTVSFPLGLPSLDENNFPLDRPRHPGGSNRHLHARGECIPKSTKAPKSTKSPKSSSSSTKADSSSKKSKKSPSTTEECYSFCIDTFQLDEASCGEICGFCLARFDYEVAENPIDGTTCFQECVCDYISIDSEEAISVPISIYEPQCPLQACATLYDLVFGFEMTLSAELCSTCLPECLDASEKPFPLLLPFQFASQCNRFCSCGVAEDDPGFPRVDGQYICQGNQNACEQFYDGLFASVSAAFEAAGVSFEEQIPDEFCEFDPFLVERGKCSDLDAEGIIEAYGEEAVSYVVGTLQFPIDEFKNLCIRDNECKGYNDEDQFMVQTIRCDTCQHLRTTLDLCLEDKADGDECNKRCLCQGPCMEGAILGTVDDVDACYEECLASS